MNSVSDSSSCGAIVKTRRFGATLRNCSAGATRASPSPFDDHPLQGALVDLQPQPGLIRQRDRAVLRPERLAVQVQRGRMPDLVLMRAHGIYVCRVEVQAGRA